MPTERRLAAIMFTDIVGYTALMAENEEKGLRARERHRALVRPLVEQDAALCLTLRVNARSRCLPGQRLGGERGDSFGRQIAGSVEGLNVLLRGSVRVFARDARSTGP